MEAEEAEGAGADQEAAAGGAEVQAAAGSSEGHVGVGLKDLAAFTARLRWRSHFMQVCCVYLECAQGQLLPSHALAQHMAAAGTLFRCSTHAPNPSLPPTEAGGRAEPGVSQHVPGIRWRTQ